MIAVTWLDRGRELRSVTSPSMEVALSVFVALKDSKGRVGTNVRLWFKGQLWCS